MSVLPQVSSHCLHGVGPRRGRQSAYRRRTSAKLRHATQPLHLKPSQKNRNNNRNHLAITLLEEQKNIFKPGQNPDLKTIKTNGRQRTHQSGHAQKRTSENASEPQLPRQLPHDDTRRDRNVERMFRTELRNFERAVRSVHHILAHALHLVAQHQRIAPVGTGLELV